MASETRFNVQKRASSFFEPDPIVTLQYFDNATRRLASMPEKMLMWAVLQDAITCIQEHRWAQNRTGRRLFREARDWITQENDGWFFSFESICASLDLNPNYIRYGLTRKKNKLSARSAEADRGPFHVRKGPAKKRKYLPAA